jgi:hypothetical protein
LVKSSNGPSVLATAYAAIHYFETTIGVVEPELPSHRGRLSRFAGDVLYSTFSIRIELDESAIDWALYTVRWIWIMAPSVSEGEDAIVARRHRLLAFLRATVELSVPGFFQKLQQIVPVAKDDLNAEAMLQNLIECGIHDYAPVQEPVKELSSVLYDFLFAENP